MGSPLFNQLMPTQGGNMIQQLMNFKKSFSGNPQEMIQQMLNSGKITQSQLNGYAQQANRLYEQMKGML